MSTCWWIVCDCFHIAASELRASNPPNLKRLRSGRKREDFSNLCHRLEPRKARVFPVCTPQWNLSSSPCWGQLPRDPTPSPLTYSKMSYTVPCTQLGQAAIPASAGEFRTLIRIDNVNERPSIKNSSDKSAAAPAWIDTDLIHEGTDGWMCSEGIVCSVFFSPRYW